MNIKVIKREPSFSHLTGGEETAQHVEISIDRTLYPYEQEGLVIHSIVETYCLSWPHDKIDELTEYIQEGLEQLKKLV